MKTICLVTLIISYSYLVMGQYVDPNGTFLKQKAIEELKQYPTDSEEQNSLQDSIIKSLMTDMLNQPSLTRFPRRRHVLLKDITDLSIERSEFFFLNKEYENQKNNKVLNKVLSIEVQIEELKDSISCLNGQLMNIALAENVSRATKEESVFALAQSNDMEVIKFIFDNHSVLNFGVLDLNEPRAEWGLERSGMHALISDKFPNHREFTNWILLDFIIEYWGKESYSDEVMNTFSKEILEFVLFHKIHNEYKKPELIYQFIKANCKNQNTEFLKRLYSHYPHY